MAANLKSEDSPQVDLLQICRRVANSEMSPDAAFSLIKNMKKTNAAIPSLLEDVLWMIDLELSVEKKHGDGSKKFNEFISLINDQIIPEDVLKLELDAVGANEQITRSRLVKVKTKLYFKQVKFNLLREESEGYAKLIAVLLDDSNKCVPSTLTKLHRLIGQFNLDPNRALDIILECFEVSPHRSQFFISLLIDFKSNADDLCNILGFKFHFYQQNGETPSSLYELAAILCSERVVDLIGLCAFLSPKQEGIVSEYKQRVHRDLKRAKRAEIISTGEIPLETNSHSSSPYIDDTSQPIAGVSFASVAAQQELEDAKLVEGELDDEAVLSKNQKLGLTFALLERGAWTFAKQLLDRFPEFYAVNASHRIALSIGSMIEHSIHDFYSEKCSKCILSEPLPLTHQNDEYAPEVVGSWSELVSVVLPVLSYLGPYIAFKPSATFKLIRLLSVFFDERQNDEHLIDSTHSDEVANVLIDAIDESLVPAMSLIEVNYSISEEMWLLLSHFPYTLRYRMYAHWKGVMTQRHQMININRGKVLGMTKYVVKRLSKETVRMMGRQLGKLCNSHPAVVFNCLLNQIQTFENLIEPVVESIRFMSDLAFDILSFCIIEHLASPDKQQLKASDGSLSPWLQSLATFVGTVFLKYNMELTGILQYVANQLKNGKSFDLLILREIIQNMSGIEPIAGLTTVQLEALSGGPTLRQEGGTFTQVRTNRRAMLRLRDALSKEHLIMGLSILIAQQRGCIVFVESHDIPLKLAGKMLDQCQETLVQFGSFLRSNLRLEEYSNRMMSVPDLISEYYLPTGVAFFLCRPSFTHKIYSNYDQCRRTFRETDGTKSKLDNCKKLAIFKEAFDEELADVEKKLVPLLPKALWADISGKVFVMFWTLTMYDISVPKAAYEREIQRLKRACSTMSDNNDMSKTKRAKEEEQLRGIEKKLSDELKRQGEHVDRVISIIRQHKETLFANCAPNMRGMQMARFLQHCVLPRAIFTDIDAVYCAQFIQLLHQQRTGFFQTVFFFDKLFNDIGIILAALTENEGNCFGRFLSLMLEIVQRWHGDKNIFDKECYGFPGFMTKLHTRNAGSTVDNSDGGMNFESYRSLCHKWQFRLARSCLAILDGGNYVLMRNCLTVMTKMLQYFPLMETHVASVQKMAVKVRDAEKGVRDDLSLMAASYASHLIMRKNKVTVFTEAQFHNRSVLNAAKQNAAAKLIPAKPNPVKPIPAKLGPAKPIPAKTNPVKPIPAKQPEPKKPVTVKTEKEQDTRKPVRTSDGNNATPNRPTDQENGAKSADSNPKKAANGDVEPRAKVTMKKEIKMESVENETKRQTAHGKSSTQTTVEERKRTSVTYEIPMKKRAKTSVPESAAPSPPAGTTKSSKSDESSRKTKESGSNITVKEESKIEEGEVPASPSSSSTSHDGHPAKKMRLSRSVEDVSRREKEKPKHEEKRDDRRKTHESSKSRQSSVEKRSKSRDRSSKRAGDSNDVADGSSKVARRENRSVDRTPESRGSKTVEFTPPAMRSSSKHRRSKEPVKTKESTHHREH